MEDSKFWESFEKSPIGIAFCNKEGNLTDINQSALKIMGFASLNDAIGMNIFNDMYISSIKDELHQKGVITLQEPFDFDSAQKLGIYNPTKSGIAILDLTISIIDSGFLMQIQDITERNETEIALKISEEQFSKAFYDNPAAMTISDESGYVDVNENFVKLTGYTREELIGHSASDLNLINKDDRDRDLKLLKANGSFHKEYELTTKSGEKRNLLSNFEVININDEFKFITFHFDITDRKNAEEKMKESKLRLNLALESGQIGVFEWNPDTGEVISDEIGKKHWGLPKESKVSYEVFIEGIHPNDREKTLSEMAKGLDPKGNGDYHSEYRVIGIKDGIERWISVNGQFFFENNKPIKQIGTTIDITEHKKAEIALKESETRFRSVLDNSQDALYRFNLKNNYYEYLSPAFEGVVGFLPKEFMSMTPEESMSIIHPNDLSVAKDSLAQLESKGHVKVDYRVRDSKGRYRWLSNHITLIRDDKGHPLYRDGTIRNITEQKEAEKKLKEAHDNLELKVEERTIELEEMNVSLKENELKLKDAIGELKRSNAELQSFAYITSHDLQEPLRNIASFAQLLQRRYQGQLDSDADDFIDFMVDGASRMKEMIQGLLEYSRIDSTQIESEVDMNEMVERAVSNLHLIVDESNAEITHDNLPVVNFGPNQMVRVFQNLIGNAIKFKKPQFPPRVHISAKKEGNEYVFSVEDNGIGMEPEYTDKIFEVFKRLHTIKEYEGTGIGLSIVRKIIESNGGRIWVKSEYGKGSTFYFTIPIK